MADNCSSFDADDTFYSALSDTSYFDINDYESNYGEGRNADQSSILERLQTQDEEARRTDELLATKLDVMASRLRGGTPNEGTPKDSTPPMPLKQILCAVEKRLKEKIRDNPLLASRGGCPESCPGPAEDAPCPGTPKRRRSPCQPRRVPLNLPTTPNCPPPRKAFFSPDPARMAQQYFESDFIRMSTGENLKGTVADIQKRRLTQGGTSQCPEESGWRTSLCRQPQPFSIQEEGCPGNDADPFGLIDIAASDYAESFGGRSCRGAGLPTPRARTRVPPPPSRPCSPNIRFSPDPFDNIDWAKEPVKTMGELIEEKRRQEEDEIINRFARQIVEDSQQAPPTPTSTPKIRRRVNRRWSPGRLAAISRRIGAPTPCYRPVSPMELDPDTKREGRRTFTRQGIRDRISLISPPPYFFDCDEIDDIDI